MSLLHNLLLTPLFDDYSDSGGGNLDSTTIDPVGSLPPDTSSTGNQTFTNPDGSGYGYGSDGSYWQQGADGSSFYQDANGQSYSSDANGNWFDQNGVPVQPGSSIWQKLGNFAKNLTSGAGGPSGASGLASALGKSASAAGNNRLNQEQLALEQEALNLRGTSDWESQLMARAQQEQALKDGSFRNLDSANALGLTANRAMNPRVSPFDPTGGPKYSPDTIANLQANAKQGQTAATTPNTYGAQSWGPMTKFQPIDLSKIQQATGTQPGLLENASNFGADVLPWLDFFLGGGSGGAGTRGGGRGAQGA
jgi:hypothetical protein